MRTQTTLMTIAAALTLACGGPKPTEPAAPTPPPSPAPEPAAAVPTPIALELPAIPAGAKVAFVEPVDGATLTGPLENGKVSVPVKMSAEGIAVKPAGPVEAGSGHHHILIDVEPGAAGAVVPADDSHLHFGKAQTEAALWLTPGPHTLTLQFADGIHRAYGPSLTSSIKVTVVAAGTAAAATTDKAQQKPATSAKPVQDDKSHDHKAHDHKAHDHKH